MKTVTLKGEVGPDGTLHLDVPAEIPPGPVEVVLRPLKPPSEPKEDLLQFLFDHTGSFPARAITRLVASMAARDRFAVRDLTRLKCRVRPMRLGDSVRLDEYDTFFGRRDVTIVPLSAPVFHSDSCQVSTHYWRVNSGSIKACHSVPGVVRM